MPGTSRPDQSTTVVALLDYDDLRARVNPQTARVDRRDHETARTFRVSLPTLPHVPYRREPVTGWSTKHERCITCGRDDRPHAARGECKTCYMRGRYRALKASSWAGGTR